MIAKDGDNTRILDIRGRGVPFRFTSIKLYYKDVNPEYDNLTNDIRPNTQLNNALDDKLRRNLTRKRGRPKKFD